MKKVSFLFVLLISGLGIFIFLNFTSIRNTNDNIAPTVEENLGGPKLLTHPLSIENLRNGDYPGSELVIEQELTPGLNYSRYIASYKSEGLKQYGLLTIPSEEPPSEGFPVVIFNHGYIPPNQYRTTERYIAYTDGFSRNGYVLFRPDYRGHGNSEGSPSGGYGSDGYVIDVLNAVSTIQKLDYVNPDKIGMWGHSMGGHITLRVMVVNPNIKAGVIWAGVVGPYPDPFLRNQGSSLNPNATPRPTRVSGSRGRWRTELIERYGTYEENKEFWNTLSAIGYAKDLAGPVQFHHGTNDSSVPVEASTYVEPILASVGKSGGLFVYEGDDHDITFNFTTAMSRSVEFFDQHLK